MGTYAGVLCVCVLFCFLVYVGLWVTKKAKADGAPAFLGTYSLVYSLAGRPDQPMHGTDKLPS